MSVPYTFGAATTAIPLSQLDSNFATTITLGNTAIQLGNTVTTLNNMTLANVTISSGNVTITNVSVTTANVGTVNATTVIATTGNITTVNATTVVATTANATTANITTGNLTDLTLTNNPTLSGGTANGVLYLNGSKVATSGSALTFDGTNLGLSNSAAATVVKIDGSGRYKQFETYSSGTRQFYIGWDNTSQVANITNDNNYPILFSITGTEQMRLTSTGLGIGTSSLTDKLTAQGTIRTTDGTNYAQFANNFLRAYASGTFYFDNATVGQSFVWRTSSGSALDTTALTLNSSGNLGIGTSSPLGTLGIAGSATTTIVIPRSSNGTTASPAETQLIGSTFTNGSYAAGIYAQNSFTNNSGNWLAFKTTDTGNTTAERMRLDAVGNLGLGVTPSAWGTFKAFQLPGGGIGGIAQNQISISQNAYYDGAGWKYLSTFGATFYQQSASQHAWYNAASGTAGNAITFTQAMTLTAAGRLGVGQTSPGTVLSVAGQSEAWQIAFTTASGTAGALIGSPAADVLAFGNWSGTERARIDSSGNLLVGTTNSSQIAGVGLKAIYSATQPGVYLVVNDAGSGTSYSLYNTNASAYRFYVDNGGRISATFTTITAISDQRLKENIQDLDVGLDKIMALKPRKFDWKPGKGKDIKGDRGWIAQEFEQVFPDMIDTWKDEPPEGEEPYKAIRADLIPVLVKAIQELKAEVDSLKSQLKGS